MEGGRGCGRSPSWSSDGSMKRMDEEAAEEKGGGDGSMKRVEREEAAEGGRWRPQPAEGGDGGGGRRRRLPQCVLARQEREVGRSSPQVGGVASAAGFGLLDKTALAG